MTFRHRQVHHLRLVSGELSCTTCATVGVIVYTYVWKHYITMIDHHVCLYGPTYPYNSWIIIISRFRITVRFHMKMKGDLHTHEAALPLHLERLSFLHEFYS